ncbi:serine/threonine-protein kinase [Candidatus Uabimicrobium sp. HlEnr_7]|uniref:serine/threonine-protein kinase n=1 Tax=Candidatus Uabimicrobium helgolandensis TaxID=3095367 RepID=UPI00355864E8
MDKPGNEEMKTASFVKQKTVQTPVNGGSSKDTAKLNRSNFVIPDVDIIDVLGEGGMGVVYKGRQTYIERDVAVKVMKPVEDSTFEERFKREAQILANLAHPNIVSCYHAGVTNGYCYIVMEFIEGMDLHQYIKKNGLLSEKQALYVVKSLAGALEYAQEKGIMHRDIKCENVLLEKINVDSSTSTAFDANFPYRVKLVDLGLAKGYSETNNNDRNITQEGSIIGTPSNMAPEQFNAEEEVDYRADIYALGCVLFFMLSASRAFSTRNFLALIHEKTQGPFPSIKNRNENISERTSQFIEYLLNSKAENRPQSYIEIIDFCDGKALVNTSKSDKKNNNIAIVAGIIFLAIVTVFFLKSGNNNVNSTKNENLKNTSQTNVENNAQQNTSNATDKNTSKNITPKQFVIKKVKWDSSNTVLFEEDYLNRLQGWERNGASSWAPSEEDKGVIGVGSGSIFRALPQAPWMVIGTIKSLSPKDRKYGVVIDCPELSYGITIQNISSNLSVVNINEEGKKRKILSSKTHNGPKVFSYEITYQNNSLTFVLNKKIVHQQKCKNPLQINLLVEKVQGVYFFLEINKGKYE